MKLLLILLCGFEVLDGLLTHFFVTGGDFREGNPLLATIATEGDFLLLKVVGAAICALLLLTVYRRIPRVTVATASTVVVFYSAVMGWNLSIVLTT